MTDPHQIPVRLPSGATVRLTSREFDVLLRMSAGMQNEEIAGDLFLGLTTVKTHAKTLFRKLGVNDRAHAVAQGFRAGVLS